MKELNAHGVWRACNKVRSAVNRIPVNLWDHFIPLDKQKKNLLPERDFIKVLTGPTGKLIGLSDQEICELSDYFRAQDGRIHYAQFCAIIHEEGLTLKKNLAWTSGEEWEDPLQNNCLSPSEERRVKIIISKIASVTNAREIILKPYFQDYELVSQNCGVVTFTHFTRILRFLDIVLASEETYLLFKKFAKDNYTVNYVAFIEAVEEAKRFLHKHKTLDEGGALLEDFPGKVMSVNLPKLPRPEVERLKTACVFPQQLHHLSIDTSSKRVRDVQEVMIRIQDYVLKNRLRVASYFQDFDVYNVGKITGHQFKRGLDNLRNYPLGRLYLGESEIENLITFYNDPSDKERVCWRIFEDDVEQVVTVKHLDKHPNCKVKAPPREVRFLPRKGFQEWECTEMMCKDAMEKKFEKTMRKVEHRIKGRRLALRPFFRDLDKNNRGHVSRSQLRRVLAVGSIPLTAEEILSLEYMFNNDDGFNYLEFMDKVEKSIGDSAACEKEKLNQERNSQVEQNKYDTANHTIEFILSKIKANIVSKGLKANEFLRKLDKLNVRAMPRSDFHRGLDQLNCNLTCSEVKTLMQHFKCPNSPDSVDYWSFCEAVEKAIAQPYMEKSPKANPSRHVPSEASPRSFLNFDERRILMRSLEYLSHFVDNNMEEIFKDLDKSHSGNVSKDQFIRTLSTRKVLDGINANELNVIFKCFTVGHVVSDPKFDYISFLGALDIVRKNRIYVPS